MSWIKDYHPKWICSLEEAVTLLETLLPKWVGFEIQETWIGLLPSSGTWWEDLPIVLVIGGVQYEICWQKFDELAITEGELNVRNCWAGGKRIPMRKNHLPELKQALGKKILGIELGESEMELGGPPIRIIHSVNFILDGGYLTIFNALDENGVDQVPCKKEFQINHPIRRTQPHL